MPIDYSVLALNKGTPIAEEKDARRKTRQTGDERENVKVKARSGGQCEVFWELKTQAVRCTNRAVPGVHHMIGGWGRRARGESIKAERKQDVCQRCHDLITSHRLRRIGSEVPHYTDVYVRVK
jgi:hypothetical protein